MDTFEGTMENFKGTLESAAISIGAVLIPVLKDIVKFLDMLANWFNALPAPIKETLTWIVAISGLLLLLGGALIKIITIGSKFVGAIKILSEAMGGLSAILTSPWLILALAIAAIVALIIMNWDSIVKFLTDTWNWIKATAESVWNAIRDFFAGIWDSMMQIFNVALDVIENLITGNWSAIKEWIVNAWTSIKNFFVDLWNSIWDFLKGVFINMVNGTKNFLADLVRFFMELPGKILSALGDLGRLLIDAGMDIMRGLIRGIENAAQWVWDKIRSIGQGIKDWFTNLLDIFSPSRVFEAYGEYTLEGYVIGLDNMEQSVYRKIAAIASNVAVEGSVEPGRAVATSAALLPATALSGGSESTTSRPIEIGTLVLKVAGNLDPTDPVGFRQTIVRIKDSIRSVEREYA
jgi:phage-related protein